MEQFLAQLPQTIVNGLTLGSVYALIALGYSMVYGILKLLNFAHGEVFMVGAYLGWATFVLLVPKESGAFLPVPVIIAIMLIVAMLGTSILGVAIERFAYRPLRNAPRIAPLISALGVSFALQNIVSLLVGARSRSIGSGTLIPADSVITLGTATIHTSRLLVVGFTLVLMIALTILVRGTRLGRALRAVAIDMEAASMMGVNIDQVIVITFVIGSALAGGAGVLMAITFFSVRPLMGFIVGLKGFTASVVGGIGSIPGAVAGGLLIGMAEAFATVYISITFKDALTFIILVIALLIRPSGLLGKTIQQKV